jgi:hypothetical protein
MIKSIFLFFTVFLCAFNFSLAQTDYIFFKDGNHTQCDIINWTPFYIHWMDTEGDIIYDTPLFLVGGFLKSDVEYLVDISGYPKIVEELEDYPNIPYLIEKYTQNKSIILIDNKQHQLVKVGGYVIQTNGNIKSVALLSIKQNLFRLSVTTGNNLIITSGMTFPIKWRKY